MYRFIALLFASALFAEPLIDQLKGVLLVPSQADVHEVETMEGFCSQGLSIPGGSAAIEKELGCDFLGKPLTEESLRDLKMGVIRYYRDQGYPVVIVEIPEQNLKNGVVQLVVIVSRVDQCQVSGNKWFFNSYYSNKFSLSKNDPLNTKDLLNDIAWLNRNPFQNATAIFSPGETPETTDVTIMPNDRFPVRIYTGADNTGNDSTQNTRIWAGCNWGYAFFLNQVLSYQYTTSIDCKSFWAHTFNYTMLFPWKNALVLYGGFSGVRPKFDDFGGTGNSYQGSLRYQIPFKPLYTTFYQELTAGFDFKRTNNNINFVPQPAIEVIVNQVNLFQLVAQYTFGMQWGKNQLTFMIESYGSPGQWLPDQQNSRYNALSFGSKNAYLYGKGSLSYLQYYRDFSFYWFLRGQGSSANLLPSEELGIGGYDTVRGYEERAINAANGVIFNFEIRSPQFPIFYHKPGQKDQTMLLVFFDYGGGNYTQKVPGVKNWLQIYSVGPGLRYHLKDYISLRFDWGFQLKTAPYTGIKNKVHLGFMLSY
ncbi:MAG: hypothetical protein K1X28_05745 [Parachlamydiales bacterium]|nr:hypothetical protein [Parachlamydiales bacterium]